MIINKTLAFWEEYRERNWVSAFQYENVKMLTTQTAIPENDQCLQFHKLQNTKKLNERQISSQEGEH